MNPIERAARALCTLDGNPENAMMDGKPLWRDYLPEVRAVIAALREPSQGMLLSGSSTVNWHPSGQPVATQLAHRTYQAMIDGLMEEPA